MSKLVLPNLQLDDVEMVIFDKDGTLIDIHHYWCSMIEFRAEIFLKDISLDNNGKELYNELISNMGIDLTTKKMKPSGPVGIKPRSFIEKVALDTILKYDDRYTIQKVKAVFNEVDEYSKNKLADIVKLLPNVSDVLKRLKDAGIKSAVATTDMTKRAVLAMETLNIERYFDDIVGADLVKEAKPSSDLVEYILDKQKTDKSKVIVVGDSMADLNMAKNTPCRFLGVKTGLYNDEFINKCDNIIVDNFTFLKVEK